ncbi:metallophosphoesterase [Vibrio coralliilyticus]|uniref:metallophosphoesterase n=1 Tax=Vibrio coralliilyticus TaxID=190893 RepID=UPI0024097989|nr:metallophosphoesterase [Vibrio coralliilyticus]WFB50409.1 metallophosphoesterase [Vibrio coralliilyticus]
MGGNYTAKRVLGLSLLGAAIQTSFTANADGDIDLGGNVKIAILPDTQYLTFNYPEIYEKQTRWLEENVDNEDIQFVIHVGDIVQKGQNDWEWEHANDAMAILDNASIPYSTTLGNHDVDKSASSWELVNALNYLKHYGPERFENMPNFIGSSENGLSVAFKYQLEEQEIIVLNMVIDPTEEDLDWGRSILRKYPDTPTILVTHRLVGENGDIGFTNNVFSGFLTNDPIQMWDKFISKEDQIFLTINGHSSPAPTNGAYNIVRTNDSGLPVNQVLVDYQNLYEDEETCSEIYPENCGEKSGKGYLRILDIDFDNNTISHRSYSPHIDEMEGDGNYLVGTEGYFTDKWNHYDDFINFEKRFAQDVPEYIEKIDIRIEYDDPENYGGNEWLTKTETTLPAGTYETIYAKASPEVEVNNEKALSWEVVDEDVAVIEIDPTTRKAVLKAIAPGETEIYARADGRKSNPVTVEVTDPVSNVYALDVINKDNVAFAEDGEEVEFNVDMSALDSVEQIELKFTMLTQTIEDDKVEVTDSVYIDTGVIEGKNGFSVVEQDGSHYTYEYLLDEHGEPMPGAQVEVTVLLECNTDTGCASNAGETEEVVNIKFATNAEVSTGKASKDDSYTEFEITHLGVENQDQTLELAPVHAMVTKDRIAFKLVYPEGDIAGEPTAGEFISDTKIDLADLAMVQRYMGSTEDASDPYWHHIRWGAGRANLSQDTDLDDNQVIDMQDFMAVYDKLDMHK